MEQLAEIRTALRSACQTVFLFGALLAALPSPAVAQDGVAGAAPADHQPTPMTKLLQRVHETFPGRILKVDLEEGEGTGQKPAMYEVKVLTSGGDVLKVFYDARTLRLEKVLGRHKLIQDSDRTMSDGGGGRSGNDDSAESDGGSDDGSSGGGSDDGSSDD